MLSVIVNDWTIRSVVGFRGVVELRLVTPDGQHVTATFSDDQARAVGQDLATMADGAYLSRARDERHELACGCDVTEFDANGRDHRGDCPIRDTFI